MPLVACEASKVRDNNEKPNQTNQSYIPTETSKLEMRQNGGIFPKNTLDCDAEDDCVPFYYYNTPAFLHYNPLYLPVSAKKELYEIFINEKSSNKSVDIYDITDHSGFIKYQNNTTLSYNLSETANISDGVNYIVYQSNINKLTKSDIAMFLKLIHMSGERDSELFLDQLISSQKLNNYPQCTVQQKQAKYGMIELSICEAENIIAFSLYNPQF